MRVCEAENQDVLHRLLAQVVIDAVDLLLGKDAMTASFSCEPAGRAERLFDDNPPRAARLIGQPAGAKLHDGSFVEARGRCQIIDWAANLFGGIADSRFSIELVKTGGQRGDVSGVAQFSGVVIDTPSKFVPTGLLKSLGR